MTYSAEMIEAIRQSTIENIETAVEYAMIGPPRAFFEVLGHRAIYEVYSYAAETPVEAALAIEHCLIRDAAKHSAGSSCASSVVNGDYQYVTALVWRLAHKLEVKEGVDRRGMQCWHCYTRVAFLPPGRQP